MGHAALGPEEEIQGSQAAGERNERSPQYPKYQEEVEPMNELLESMLESYNKENYLSGNIYISRNGKELFCKSFGQASVQLNF